MQKQLHKTILKGENFNKENPGDKKQNYFTNLIILSVH